MAAKAMTRQFSRRLILDDENCDINFPPFDCQVLSTRYKKNRSNIRAWVLS